MKKKIRKIVFLSAVILSSIWTVTVAASSIDTGDYSGIRQFK